MDYTVIKDLVKKNKVTLKALAEGIGITEQGLHGYIKKNTMPINLLEEIAQKLNVDLVFLISGGKHNIDAASMPQNVPIVDLLRDQMLALADCQKEKEQILKEMLAMKDGHQLSQKEVKKINDTH
jgi:transcriptional regulator with XRE-family HTH domain